jgi:hypothetical protein
VRHIQEQNHLYTGKPLQESSKTTFHMALMTHRCHSTFIWQILLDQQPPLSFFFLWISNNNLLFLILCFSQILCLKDYSLPLFIAFSLTQLNYFFSQPLSFNPFTPSRSLPWLNNPHDLYRVQMSTPIVWPGRRSVDGERLGKWEGFFFFFFISL